MAFIYDARITVRSVIENLDEAGLVVGDPEISIGTYDGFLRCEARESGDLLTISYSERVESGDKVYTDMTIDGGTLTLMRRGACEYDIRFTEGEGYEGIYAVPPYKFDMTVLTKRLRSGLTRRGGEIRINYNMAVGGADKSCRMHIKLEVKR